MKKFSLLMVLLGIGIITLILAMGIGSVPIAPNDAASIICHKIFGSILSPHIDDVTQSILLKIRIPRALLAFVCGSGLAVSGVMMQSVLRNPLASSFTLGVSSGAALGASVVILFGISSFGFFTLPIFGLVAGVGTVFLALLVASKIDRNMQNNSIILTGMAFSLFANSMITIIMSLSKEELQRLIYWQMGSFATKAPEQLYMLLPIVIIGIIVVLRCSKQMDVMTLGDEQAQTTGIATKQMKWFLLTISAILTGTIVSVVGIIGFVDLFTPHVARKLFGASHKYVIPAAALLGGIFMVACDLLARTMVAPLELPVGAITSAIGAPFFIYLYFSKRKIKG